MNNDHEWVTEDMFIFSLKVTTIFAFNNTPVVPFAGYVVVISGPITSFVMNAQGLGTEPLIKSFPPKSFPAVIPKEYVVVLPKGLCENVAIEF